MTSQYHLPLRLRIQPSPLLLLDMLLPFPSNNVFRATIVAQPNRQEKPHFSPKLTDITQLKTAPEKVQKTQKTIIFCDKIRSNSICKFFVNRFIMVKPRRGFSISPRSSFHYNRYLCCNTAYFSILSNCSLLRNSSAICTMS
jgi:hypothetical protein